MSKTLGVMATEIVPKLKLVRRGVGRPDRPSEHVRRMYRFAALVDQGLESPFSMSREKVALLENLLPSRTGASA